jgi:threonine dehydratase
MTFPLVQHLVDEVVTVSEAALIASMRRMAADEHLIVEGASAVVIAAIEGGQIGAADGPVVAIVSGANIDLDTFLAAVAPPER